MTTQDADREAIARIIDPAPFNDEADDETCGCEECKAERLELRTAALAKTDAILALRAPAQGDVVRTFDPNSDTIADLVQAVPPPTDEQKRVGEMALDDYYNGNKTEDVQECCAHVYRAMAALATLPPSMGVERGKEGAVVAWRYRHKVNADHHAWSYTDRKRPSDMLDWEIEELYAAPTPSASRGMERESVVEALREAFIAGANAVHVEWVSSDERGDGPPRGTPDFTEAATDYALAAPQSQNQIHESSETE